MSVYQVTYDLNKDDKDYEDLFKEIKSSGAWAHYLDSTWFVCTSYTASTLRDKLHKVIDDNDLLFISKVTSDYAGLLNTKAWDWLKEHLD